MHLCESFPNQSNLLSLKIVTFYLNFPGLYFFSPYFTIFYTTVGFNCIGVEKVGKERLFFPGKTL